LETLSQAPVQTPTVEFIHTGNERLYPPPLLVPKHEVELPQYEVKKLNPRALGSIVAWTNPDVALAIGNWPDRNSVHETARRSKEFTDPYATMMVLHNWAHQDKKDATRTQLRRGLPPEWNEDLRKHFHALFRILEWGSNAETRKHIDPPPPMYTPHDPDLLAIAVSDLALYYLNFEINGTAPEVSPGRLAPIVAYDKTGEPQGVLTIRWHGDPYIEPEFAKTAAIERLMVNPDFQGKGMGRVLVRAAKNQAIKRNFTNQRAWVMIGERFGRYDKPVNLFTSEGFRPYQSEYGTMWSQYCKERSIGYREATDGEAIWLDCDLTKTQS
jgi:GNAT superfamily N-acetyltransferase